jgi:hypothetical protein
MAKSKLPTKVDKGVKLRDALKEALGLLDRGKALPAHLEAALLKFDQANWRDIDRRVLIPKVEERFQKEGLPRSKKSRGTSSLEATAKVFDVSESTVERAVDAHKASGRGSRLSGPQKR